LKAYQVNEIFFTIQGEGVRAGVPSIFVRMSGCNLQCRMEPGPLSPGNFDCDTEFASGRKLTSPELLAECASVSSECRSIVLTGGEPGLQWDSELCAAFHGAGYYVAIETNGSIHLDPRPDWVCVSPKVAEHAVRQLEADEVKYVRDVGQAIPRPSCHATHKIISPAFRGDGVSAETLKHCIDLVKGNPEWRLSLQQHKLWGIR
jgi:organic radical activating enzyme